MHRLRSATLVAAMLAALLLAGFAAWYSGSEPLSKEEVEQIMTRLARQRPEALGDFDLAAFRAFLEADDGEPVYNLNLFKFRDRARYAGSVSTERSGREAFEEYAAFMLRELPRHASHAVFGSTRTFSSDWDLVVTARYRSRRDMAEIFTSDAFNEAVVHKWAALERNIRVPVATRGLFSSAYLLVAALLLALVGIVWLVERLRSRRADLHSSVRPSDSRRRS